MTLFWNASSELPESEGRQAGGGVAGLFVVVDGAELIWFTYFEVLGVMNVFVAVVDDCTHC